MCWWLLRKEIQICFHSLRCSVKNFGLSTKLVLAIQATITNEVGWLLCQCLTLEWYLHKNTLGLEPKKETFGYCHTLRNYHSLVYWKHEVKRIWLWTKKHYFNFYMNSWELNYEMDRVKLEKMNYLMFTWKAEKSRKVSVNNLLSSMNTFFWYIPI